MQFCKMFYKRLLALLLLLLSASGAQTAAGNASECPCEPEGLRAICSFMGLTRVPACLTGRPLTHLYLDNNRVEQLTAEQLRPFPQLRMLSLEDNTLQSLPDDAFRHTPLLRELYLSTNHIEHLSPATFQSLPSLHTLDISRNRMRRLPAAVFRGLPKLIEVDLSDNLLTEFPEDALPPSVRVLRLHKNRLTDLPAKWPASLEELDLSENQLQSAEATSLEHLTALRDLRLEDNPWNCECESVGSLTRLVQRRRFEDDMDEPMTCHAPDNVRGSPVLNVMSECVPTATDGSADGPWLMTRTDNYSETATNTTDAGPTICLSTSHATNTITTTIFVLLISALCVLLIFLVQRSYLVCRKEFFPVKQDTQRLTLEDEESIV